MPSNHKIERQPGPIIRYLTGADLVASGNAEARLFFRRIAVAFFLALILAAKAIVFCIMLIALTDSWGVR